MGASRGLLFALISGIASAILSIGSFGSAPILAMGLYQGSALAGISAGIAALLLLVNFNSASTIFFIAGTGLPALLLVRQALISQPGTAPNTIDWYPPGQILGWLTAYALAILLCIGIYFALSSESLESVSRDYLSKFFAQLLQESSSSFPSETERTLVNRVFEAATIQMAPLLVGYIISAYFLMLIINATITQGILNKAGISLRPSPSYVTMALPRWLSGALAAALVTTVLPGGIGVLGKNAVMVLSIPFLLLGLTVIHTLSRRSPNPGKVLVAIYFALFLLAVLANFSLPILAMLILLGIAEQWTSLRRRLAAPGTNQEDE